MGGKGRTCVWELSKKEKRRWMRWVEAKEWEWVEEKKKSACGCGENLYVLERLGRECGGVDGRARHAYMAAGQGDV